jgi:predicted RNA-binding protein with PIN domain
MPYLIDGHNLIPKIGGLSLKEVDDEMQLIELLVAFCRRKNKQVEVFFDKAPPGGQHARKFGRVTARFVREGTTADEAIRLKVKRLGNESRNWTVVSSDRMVQAEARAARARVMSSEAFAALLSRQEEKSGRDLGEDPDAALSDDELDEWLQLFSK